ncbi:MAG: AIR synthase related protein, partial [Nitrospinales bacterium]
CRIDPYGGAQIAVAECCRNVVCSGAAPIGATNCLNFGNPEKPEIMWQFEQAIRGIGDACKYLDIPVVSGNVSLYNETKGKSINPTPVIAVVGLLEDQTRHCTQWFKKPDHLIALLGATREELGGSEYLETLLERRQGKIPRLDLKEEKRIHGLCLELIGQGLIASAHDCSEGGLAVSLAECCVSGPERALGATLDLQSAIRADALMFGESQSRILVSLPRNNRAAAEKLARQWEAPFSVIGEVGGDRLAVNINNKEFINEDITSLRDVWKDALGRYGRQVT